MQNRYVGDIGDFVKLAILRVLAAEDSRKLGVLWWLHADENHNADGKHRRYLARPHEWRKYDTALFDGLAAINEKGPLDVCALQEARFLADAVYFSPPLPLRQIRRFVRKSGESGWRKGAAKSSSAILFFWIRTMVSPPWGLSPRNGVPQKLCCWRIWPFWSARAAHS